MTAAGQADAIGKQRSTLRRESLLISLIELQAVVPVIHLRRKSTKSLDRLDQSGSGSRDRNSAASLHWCSANNQTAFSLFLESAASASA